MVMATKRTIDELPTSAAASAPTQEVLTHQNRRGERYYLHEGQTKTGKPRYFFAKSVREGALGQMPEGYEVSESINAVVSVRRTKRRPGAISASDLQLAQDELARHRHLQHHQARVKESAIVVYELSAARYQPVMKFERETGGYTVYRMTYRGHGGWSYPLATGALDTLLREYARHVGTDEFFNLM